MKKLKQIPRTLATLIFSVLIISLGFGAFTVNAVTPAQDEEVPSYVDNVKAYPGDGEIRLTWDASTDNVGVTGYKIYMGLSSVSQVGQSYDLGSVNVANVLEYTVSDLDNGTAYYFAITALDAVGNESVDYSYEVSATPEASVDENKGNPVVVSAKALDCETVLVTFSEPVKYPIESTNEAFKIEDIDTVQYIKVIEVSYAKGDQSGLNLTTEKMQEKSQYLMTVGSDVEDKYGNAIVSGTSDTAVFSGTACEEPTDPVVDEEHDLIAPHLKTVNVTDSTNLEVAFDETVVLPEPEVAADDDGDKPIIDPALALFKITDNNGVELEILTVDYKDTGEVDADNNPVFDKTTLVLKIAEQKSETQYKLAVTGLEDEVGNATDGQGFSSVMTYVTPQFKTDEPPVETPDTVAPEDVTNLVADVVDMLVNLDWKASLNSAGDLVSQMLYVKTSDGTYDQGQKLEDSAIDYTYKGGVEGQTYTFKVTTVDDSGNESEGTVVTATLPTTGAGIGLLALASILGGGLIGRNKK